MKVERSRPVERSPANRGGDRKSVRVVSEQAEAKPRQPIVIPWFIGAFGRGLWAVAKWIAPIVAIYGIAWYLFGETTITATLDDKPVKTQVWIDGDFVGDTPYTTRLGFGRFEVNVLPPENNDTNESEWRITMWSVVLGKDIPADFTSIDETE